VRSSGTPSSCWDVGLRRCPDDGRGRHRLCRPRHEDHPPSPSPPGRATAGRGRDGAAPRAPARHRTAEVRHGGRLVAVITGTTELTPDGTEPTALAVPARPGRDAPLSATEQCARLRITPSGLSKSLPTPNRMPRPSPNKTTFRTSFLLRTLLPATQKHCQLTK
jgi:hypothetical protein